MTKAEKQAYMEQKSVGYYSGFGGIEVKEIQYGIEDYIIFVAGAWCSAKSVHRRKIQYNMSGDNFIVFANCRLYLRDFMRM